MIERIFELGAVVISIIGSIIIIKSNVKKYIILYIASSMAGALLCLLFVAMGFYSFPVKLVPLSPIPIIEMFTTIPFYVLVGVRYSPQKLAVENSVLLGTCAHRDGIGSVRVISSG
ncbi:CBO0543 family protein [Bacillus suaedaesalsae]|uniref:CBO0543 family protein n=1 Tax=Bacillus suaedaesalsae TaxID=2810349 RepID=UPI001EF6B1DB|nr:CBO0543 family protein [Bacillus suaedaesalsae]